MTNRKRTKKLSDSAKVEKLAAEMVKQFPNESIDGLIHRVRIAKYVNRAEIFVKVANKINFKALLILDKVIGNLNPHKMKWSDAKSLYQMAVEVQSKIAEIEGNLLGIREIEDEI